MVLAVSTLLRSMGPPNRLAGRLAAQSLLFSLGIGTFLTGSAAFFTQVVGLTAIQVGLGLTIAGIASFLATLPMGRLVDRFGPKRMWATSAGAQAALFCLWPFIDTFEAYVAMAVTMEISTVLGTTAHGAYVIDLLPPAQRVRSRAYMYSALNLGFSLGAGVGGLALALHDDTWLRSVPWFTAALFGLNAILLARMPNAPHDDKSPEERRKQIDGPGPMRNAGWLGTNFLLGILWTNQVILNVVIPLWVVQQTDAPRVLLAFLFGTNTVLCIALPMSVSRGVKGTETALSWTRISSAFYVLACLITLATHESIGWQTIVLIWIAHVVVTGAELFLTPAHWQLEADLMDHRRRGSYQAAAEFSVTLGRVWAPAAFTFLALTWGAAGWLVIAAAPLLAALALPATVRSAQRFISAPTVREAVGGSTS